MIRYYNKDKLTVHRLNHVAYTDNRYSGALRQKDRKHVFLSFFNTAIIPPGHRDYGALALWSKLEPLSNNNAIASIIIKRIRLSRLKMM